MDNRQRRRVRQKRGAVTHVLAAVTLPVCLAIAALAVDFGHGVLVRAQLQSACDAAALAGAKSLIGDVGPLTDTQITLAESDAGTVGNANMADEKQVSVIVDNPPPMYNSPPYSAQVPQYYVSASATMTTSNVFARLIGINSEPISAKSRAGVFPQSTASTSYGSLASITAPIAVTIDVSASNNQHGGVALSSVQKGQGFTITCDGTMGGGSQNASFIELQQGTKSSPLCPLASSTNITDQFAAQSNPGIINVGSGTPYAFVSGAGSNSSTSGPQGWLTYIVNEIVANGGSVNLTLPIISDPNGNSNSSSLNSGSELQIIGVATFNITQTGHGPGQTLPGNATFYGTLVNALPLSASNLAAYPTFFNQFQGGNSGGNGGSSQGTPQVRLF